MELSSDENFRSLEEVYVVIGPQNKIEVFAYRHVADERSEQLSSSVQKAKVQFSLPPHKSLADLQTISQKMQEKEKAAKTNAPDDPMNPDWPFGFDCFGKAITMREMLEDPDSALDPSFFEPSDRWKVVKARIKRYTDQWISLPWIKEPITRYQALDHVSRKTNFGRDIRDGMIDWLQDRMNEAWEKRKSGSVPDGLYAAVSSSEDHDDYDNHGSWMI